MNMGMFVGFTYRRSSRTLSTNFTVLSRGTLGEKTARGF